MTSKLVFDAEKMRHRLIEERKKRYDNQQQLADALGYSKNAISNIEKEKNPSIPSAETIAKLSKLYGVSADYLLGISDYTSQKIADLGEPLGLSEKSVKGLKALKSNETTGEASAHRIMIEWFLGMAYEYYEKDGYQYFYKLLTLIYEFVYSDYINRSPNDPDSYHIINRPAISDPMQQNPVTLSIKHDPPLHWDMPCLFRSKLRELIGDCLDKMREAVFNPYEYECVDSYFEFLKDESEGGKIDATSKGNKKKR